MTRRGLFALFGIAPAVQATGLPLINLHEIGECSPPQDEEVELWIIAKGLGVPPEILRRDFKQVRYNI